MIWLLPLPWHFHSVHLLFPPGTLGSTFSFQKCGALSCLWVFDPATHHGWKNFYSLSMCVLSHVQLFATLWTIARKVLLSMGFSRQEWWNGLPFSSPGDLPNTGIEPELLASPAFAGGFFTTSASSLLRLELSPHSLHIDPHCNTPYVVSTNYLFARLSPLQSTNSLRREWNLLAHSCIPKDLSKASRR